MFSDINDLVDFVVTSGRPYTFTVTSGKRRAINLNKAMWVCHSAVCEVTGDTKERQHLRFKEEVVAPYLDQKYPEMEIINSLEYAKKDPNTIERWGEIFPASWFKILNQSIRTRDLEHEELKECMQEYNNIISRRGIIV